MFTISNSPKSIRYVLKFKLKSRKSPLELLGFYNIVPRRLTTCPTLISPGTGESASWGVTLLCDPDRGTEHLHSDQAASRSPASSTSWLLSLVRSGDGITGVTFQPAQLKTTGTQTRA